MCVCFQGFFFQLNECQEKRIHLFIFTLNGYLLSTHETLLDVVDGQFDVHAAPVIENITNAGCAVDEPHIVF